MTITSRAKAIAFFITLGACLVALTIALNVSWIVLNWREVVPLVLGVILFGFIIAGVVINTIFLVREIRRNEQHDSFLNAVTHELKTPIASLRLYLETLESRQLDAIRRGVRPSSERALASPPCSRSSRVFSRSGTAHISAVAPPSLRALGSAPASSRRRTTEESA